MKPGKIVFKIDDCFKCKYRYKIVHREKETEATVLEISSQGFIMITKEFLRPKRILEVDIPEPLGPLRLTAEVKDAKFEWYISDKHKDMYFTTEVIFKNLSLKKRRQIITYIYKCKEERRKARLKRLGL